MFDVDATFRQTEIWAIVATAGIGDVVFVVWLVFVFDAVFVKPVGDYKLLETFDAFALQGPQIGLFDVCVEFVLFLEIPFTFLIKPDV